MHDKFNRLGNMSYNKYKDKLLILSLNVTAEQLENKEINNQVTSISNFLQNLEGPVLSYSRKKLGEIPENFQELEFNSEMKSQYFDYYTWENQK